jgi:hypothetical protein
MITVKARGYSKPHHLDFENNGVINPGIYQDGDTVHILLPGGTVVGCMQK